VLLAKESNPVEHLPRATTRFLETDLEVGVLALELLDSLRTCARGAGRRLERFHSRFCVKSAPAERRELVTKVTDELVEVGERFFQLSLFVV
jgi:hypothetical protein